MLLGSGILSWPMNERATDRYGSVGLFQNGEVKDLHNRPEAGSSGRLVAVILHTRPSGHPGDLFRGLSPVTPEIGDRIVLGEGEVHFCDADLSPEGPYIGLVPNDGRNDDWLDPKALYRCHDQAVALHFEPDLADA